MKRIKLFCFKLNLFLFVVTKLLSRALNYKIVLIIKIGIKNKKHKNKNTKTGQQSVVATLL